MGRIVAVIPDTWRVEVVWSALGEIAVNTFHVNAPGGTGFTADIREDTVNDIKAFLTTAKQQVSDKASVTVIRLRDVGVVAGPVFEYPQTTITGQATGVPLPPQCAVGITWTTAKSGRSYRGRTYLPFPSSMMIDSNDGRLELGRAGALASAGRTLINNLNQGTGVLAPTPLVVASFTKAERAEADPKELVTGVKVGRAFDTQRRRRSSFREDYVVG
jgi:hypothetical protein